MKRNDPLRSKSYAFALDIVSISRDLVRKDKEFVLGRQLMKSGTAIGAQIREARFAQSRKDFISKMSIALKEASETEYWIDLLHDSHYMDVDQFANLSDACDELISMLVATVKTSKSHS